MWLIKGWGIKISDETQYTSLAWPELRLVEDESGFVLLTGLITLTQWCTAMEEHTRMGIPWRMLREKLVTLDPSTGKVEYNSTFQEPTNGRRSVCNPIFRRSRIWGTCSWVTELKTGDDADELAAFFLGDPKIHHLSPFISEDFNSAAITSSLTRLIFLSKFPHKHFE